MTLGWGFPVPLFPVRVPIHPILHTDRYKLIVATPANTNTRITRKKLFAADRVEVEPVALVSSFVISTKDMNTSARVRAHTHTQGVLYDNKVSKASSCVLPERRIGHLPLRSVEAGSGKHAALYPGT